MNSNTNKNKIKNKYEITKKHNTQHDKNKIGNIKHEIILNTKYFRYEIVNKTQKPLNQYEIK